MQLKTNKIWKKYRIGFEIMVWKYDHLIGSGRNIIVSSVLISMLKLNSFRKRKKLSIKTSL